MATENKYFVSVNPQSYDFAACIDDVVNKHVLVETSGDVTIDEEKKDNKIQKQCSSEWMHFIEIKYNEWRSFYVLRKWPKLCMS